jgi:hypothetical protein
MTYKVLQQPGLRRMIEGMARGWESKSIEAQQEDASRQKTSEKPRLTREETALAQEIASVRLSLSRVLQQLGLTQNLRHREILERAKTELERKLEELGQRSVHQTK